MSEENANAMMEIDENSENGRRDTILNGTQDITETQSNSICEKQLIMKINEDSAMESDERKTPATKQILLNDIEVDVMESPNNSIYEKQLIMKTNEDNSVESDNKQTPASKQVVSNDIEEDIKESQVDSTSLYQTSFQYPSLFSSKTIIELSNSSWKRTPSSKEDIQPYLRGCKWSPDGTCCLSVVNNDGVHITELPRDLYSGSANSKRTIDILDSVIHVKETGLIYDFCWYPGMNSTVPESCCWLTTRQNAPVQMWDAFDGSLRCSYRGFNAVDEMEPALSVTFSPNGSRIIAGYKKYLRTFDVERPGRDFAEHKINSPATCFASDSNLLAVGSWNTTIHLYNITEMGTYKSIGKMHGHSGGVTHMKFTPDGLKLVSGARKDHRLLVWDIRYYRRPLNVLSRTVSTNQRIYFDVSPCGKYLVTGGTDGTVKVWDVEHSDWKSSLDVTDNSFGNATYKFPLHIDCCNSISIHPYRPILATGSGQYHFTDPIKSLEDNRADCGDIMDNDHRTLPELTDEDIKYSSESENCLVFWWIGDVQDLT